MSLLRNQTAEHINNIIAVLKFFVTKLGIIVLLISFIAAIIFINSTNNVAIKVRTTAQQGVFRVYEAITYPFFLVSNFGEISKNYWNVIEDNRHLKHENLQLRDSLQKLEIEVSENNSLKKLLNLHIDHAANIVTARIISYNTNPLAESFIINAGSKHDIKPGQAVINEKGLIGKVTEVTRNSAKVLAITDVSSRIPAMLSKSRCKFIATGNKNTYLKMNYLVNEDAVEANELAITSGEGGDFPYGILIGKVFFNSDGRPHVRLAVDFNELEFVQVVSIKDE